MTRDVVEWVGRTVFNARLPTYYRKQKECLCFPSSAATNRLSGDADVLCDIKLLFKMVASGRSTLSAGGDPTMDCNFGLLSDGAISRVSLCAKTSRPRSTQSRARVRAMHDSSRPRTSRISH